MHTHFRLLGEMTCLSGKMPSSARPRATKKRLTLFPNASSTRDPIRTVRQSRRPLTAASSIKGALVSAMSGEEDPVGLREEASEGGQALGQLRTRSAGPACSARRPLAHSDGRKKDLRGSAMVCHVQCRFQSAGSQRCTRAPSYSPGCQYLHL